MQLGCTLAQILFQSRQTQGVLNLRNKPAHRPVNTTSSACASVV